MKIKRLDNNEVHDLLRQKLSHNEIVKIFSDIEGKLNYNEVIKLFSEDKIQELETLIKKLDNNGDYIEIVKLILEISKDENSISLLIQYFSSSRYEFDEDNCIFNYVKDMLANTIGKVGGPIIDSLIKLYRSSTNNLAARYYSIYAISECSNFQSNLNEARKVLLDAITSSNMQIRTTAGHYSKMPHDIRNISHWLIYYYLEYQLCKETFCGEQHDLEPPCSPEEYFCEITDAEFQELERLTAKSSRQEEIIGLSIVISAISSRNTNHLIRQLLLKVEAEELKELLLDSICFNEFYQDDIAFLENLKKQKISGKTFVNIVDIIMRLKSRKIYGE